MADLTGTDFERLRASLAKTRGPVSIGNEVQRVRTLFKYAWDEGLIEKLVRFGSGFRKPNRKAMRKARHAAGPKMIEADALRRLLDVAGQPMRSMILLALNAGYGQTDVANLPSSAIDFATGWIDYPREKTAVGRRCPLWPETLAALQDAIATRPAPKDPLHAGLAFITKFGHKWVRTRVVGKGRPTTPIDSVHLEFQKLPPKAGIERASFYHLRHVHRTVADGEKDQVAADFIMGHVPTLMASAYRERIEDGRLKAVTDVVRAWLWPGR